MYNKNKEKFMMSITGDGRFKSFVNHIPIPTSFMKTRAQGSRFEGLAKIKSKPTANVVDEFAPDDEVEPLRLVEVTYDELGNEILKPFVSVPETQDPVKTPVSFYHVTFDGKKAKSTPFHESEDVKNLLARLEWENKCEEAAKIFLQLWAMYAISVLTFLTYCNTTNKSRK